MEGGRSSCCTTRTRLRFSRSRRSSCMIVRRRKDLIHARLVDENFDLRQLLPAGGVAPTLTEPQTVGRVNHQIANLTTTGE